MDLKETFDKMWPVTKKELEKAIENAKDLISKGEDSLKVMSDKSMATMKQVALSLKKEQVCFELGKTVAATAPAKWKTSKKIADFLKEIKKIDQEIKKLK